MLLWNNGDGTFTEGARQAGVVSFGWHTGAAIADVNGDGRPDLFVSGYTDMHAPDRELRRGLPGEPPGRPRPALPERGRHRTASARSASQAGLDTAPYDHSLGASFTDVNGDGRPDLYVANDHDPNRLYLNEPGGPLGFHFVDERARLGSPTRTPAWASRAPTTTATAGPTSSSRTRASSARRLSRARSGRLSRRAHVVRAGARHDRRRLGRLLGRPRQRGQLDLVLANGAIPVTNLAKDAGPIQVLANGRRPVRRRPAVARRAPLVNGRGLAAADYDNDGRVDVAVNSIGGKLILLHNTGARPLARGEPARSRRARS